MKCPDCDYNGESTIDEYEEEIEPREGRFFKLPIKMERSVPWNADESKRVYGCPSCLNIFMED